MSSLTFPTQFGAVTININPVNVFLKAVKITLSGQASDLYDKPTPYTCSSSSCDSTDSIAAPTSITLSPDSFDFSTASSQTLTITACLSTDTTVDLNSIITGSGSATDNDSLLVDPTPDVTVPSSCSGEMTWEWKFASLSASAKSRSVDFTAIVDAI